MNKKKIVHP